jgi:purine-binding chemotaxis protein CheW
MSEPSIFSHDTTPEVPAPEGPKPAARFRDRVRERSGTQDLLVVRIGAERFAVPLDAIDELVEQPRIRKVPGAPAHLVGLFTLGEATLPLFSPSMLLGMEPRGEQVALVMHGGGVRMAIAVDDADDVISVALADVLDAPRTGHYDDVVLGVVWNEGELLTLLDSRAIVASYASRPSEAA